MLPNMDHPEAFGQHPNADITSQIQETRLLFETLLSLQPQIASGGGESTEDQVCVFFTFRGFAKLKKIQQIRGVRELDRAHPLKTRY